MKLRKAYLSIFLSSLLIVPSLVGAQINKPILVAPSASDGALDQPSEPGMPTPRAQVNQAAVFRRVDPEKYAAVSNQAVKSTLVRPAATAERGHRLAAAKPKKGSVTAADIGTGSGDINEAEPNDQVAQNVDIPVNIFGDINKNGDVDAFAFQTYAGEQINVISYASQIGSNLIPDIALFDANGNVLDEEVGDGVNDPFIQVNAPADGFYIAAITDADGLGGSHFNYILSINVGVEVQEVEPNDTNPNILPALPVTVFGEISTDSDRDFYSFQGIAGQTLIVDVDAQVFGSNLNAEVNLTDPSTGIQYFYNDNTDGDDPRFNIVLPYTGTYVLGIDASGGSSSGSYSVNLSLVSGKTAPGISSVTVLGPKHLQVNGFGFPHGGAVFVNGNPVPTAIVDRHDLRGKVKTKSGQVVTVTVPPDGRRSNPLIVQ